MSMKIRVWGFGEDCCFESLEAAETAIRSCGGDFESVSLRLRSDGKVLSGNEIVGEETWYGYVRTDDGEWYVQKPDSNPHGFILANDAGSWDGGFGVAASWIAVPRGNVPEEVREEMDWLLE